MKDFNFSDLFEEAVQENTISVIADLGEMNSQAVMKEVNFDSPIPILPVRHSMLFPGTILPIGISRKSSLELLQAASKNNTCFAVFSETSDDEDSTDGTSRVYSVGVIARVLKLIQLPGGNYTALLRGFDRVNLLEIVSDDKYLIGRVEHRPESVPGKNKREFSAVVDACKDVANKFMRMSDMISQTFTLNNLEADITMVNYLCMSLSIDNDKRFALLREDDQLMRANGLLIILQKEYQYAKLKANLQTRTREELDKQQRDFFLRHEMENIRQELGESKTSDVEKLRARSIEKNMPKHAREVFDTELDKLGRENPSSPDYQVCYNYLDTFLKLPWEHYTKDNLNLRNAERVLNKEHFGMEKVKERILEHLAVLQMRGDFRSPIICLYGPPGVGKTSLGKSIAKAMKREYVRVSLGGLHDESEIRGHRRTYIGAMPGRIIKGLIKAGSSNPVFILDEIDKVTGATHQGDPSSALLEVLDPEQNGSFHDNFLEVDYDLSKVMFIATANDISTIPAALRDRMELIEVSGYLTEEKIEIARKHLMPKAMESTGMLDKKIKISKAAIEKIIEDYTRESGVRGLEKMLGKLYRKVAYSYAYDEHLPEHDIKPADLQTYLGTPPYNRDSYQGNEHCGVVTGLAWTSVGGEILFIETSICKSKGAKLTLTGNLGDVMKESATIALEYLKAHTELLGDGEDWTEYFDTHSIHVHVPEGATPKDGPSAGITIATSIASAITQRKVRARIAMTGEITLRGKVLPIGGVKEKILAAKRAGITDIIVCNDNRKNVLDIPEIYVKGVTFHYVDTVKDVLEFALL